MRVCVFEDFAVRDLEPLALTRPAFDLRCGAGTLLERQARCLSAREVGALVREELEGLCRATHPDLAVNDAAWLGESGVVLVNARWLPPPLPRLDVSGPAVGLVGEQVAFVALPSGPRLGGPPGALDESLEEWARTLPCAPAGGRMIDAPWDLVEHNADVLAEDALRWGAGNPRSGCDGRGRPGLAVEGPPGRLFVDPAARVEPHVLVDTSRGPVLIDAGAVVEAFSRLEGPCYVGPFSRLSGARVCGGSIGPHCRVGGEVVASILDGHCRKGQGYLGHSYVGAWVRLGAGTQTADRRNDGEPISMEVGGVPRSTGLTRVGAFLGDHTQTGVGTLLNAGTVVGPFCQLLPWGSLLPRRVPAFTGFGHGQLRERTDLRQMLTTAARVTSGGSEWTEAHTEYFFSLFEGTARQRKQALREAEQKRLRRTV